LSKNIGIIYYFEDEKEYKIISDFVRYLQEEHKIVKALGYAPDKIIPHYFYPKIFFDIFLQTDVNKWTGIPNKQCVKDFIDTEYDLLIDLSLNNIFPLDYIGILSKAKFKVGKYDNTRKKYYDMMIDIKNNKDLRYLIEQIIQYIKIFNKQ